MSNPKPKHRFYIPPENISDKTILVTQPEYHHIVDVIRFKEGDSICIFDGKGSEYFGSIVSIDRLNKNIKVKINEVYKEKGSQRPLIFVQSLVKANKMDFIIQKATELGVTHIFPVRTEHSVVRLDSKKEGLKINKWKRIAQEASKQCGRTVLPVLDKVWKFDEVLDALDWVENKIICTIQDRGINLLYGISKFSSSTPGKSPRGHHRGGTGAISKKISSNKPESMAIVIGPEGGFTDAELELAQTKAWVPVRLGNIKMRSETAAIVILGILCYELGYWA